MSALADAIRKVATGPHLSKDLSRDEACSATMEILDGHADAVQAAVFFIALRMKRETDEENAGILQALQSVTQHRRVEAPRLLILSEPFNGFNRHCPVAAFLPALLAACGLPALSQGVVEMGPKFGVTHAQVLALAGYDIGKGVDDAAADVDNDDIGWAYLDQQQATPALFALQDLRRRMIKRPSLATLEKLVMPLQASRATHLGIGFVHKAYPPVLGRLAAGQDFASALIVRGLEGGVVPTLREPSHHFRMVEGAVSPCMLDPREVGITQQTRGVRNEQDKVTAAATLAQGLEALKGRPGPAFDSLVYGAAMLVWHCGLQATPAEAANQARDALLSGKALSHFNKGIQ